MDGESLIYDIFVLTLLPHLFFFTTIQQSSVKMFQNKKLG